MIPHPPASDLFTNRDNFVNFILRIVKGFFLRRDRRYYLV